MAGHSKWANIRHRKAGQDAKRGKVFTKLIREITVAARMGGGGELGYSPRLRAAVDKALAVNMSRDTIDRAIKRGTGEGDFRNPDELTYEGYGPGGVAILVETMTDNVNRTVAEVRHAFAKAGGNLGTSGSVAYLFKRRGEISFPADVDEDVLMEKALDAGAEDIQRHDDGSFDVITTFESFGSVLDVLKAAGFTPTGAEVTMAAENRVDLDLELAEKVMHLIDAIEDLDDVQNVYSNANFTEELMGQMTA